MSTQLHHQPKLAKFCRLVCKISCLQDARPDGHMHRSTHPWTDNPQKHNASDTPTGEQRHKNGELYLHLPDQHINTTYITSKSEVQPQTSATYSLNCHKQCCGSYFKKVICYSYKLLDERSRYVFWGQWKGNEGLNDTI